MSETVPKSHHAAAKRIAPMNDAAKEAAHIVRNYPVKTIKDLCNVARKRAANNENGKGAFLDRHGDATEHGWVVADAHIANLSKPEYREAAGLPPRPTTDDEAA